MAAERKHDNRRQTETERDIKKAVGKVFFCSWEERAGREELA